MMARLRVGVLALAATPLAMMAQSATVRFDSATARTLTVGALLTASRTASAAVRSTVPGAPALAIVDRLLSRLDRPAVTALPLDTLARALSTRGASPRASVRQIARFRRAAVADGIGAGDAADLDSLVRLTRAEVRFAMERRSPTPVSDDSVDLLLAPYDALQRLQLDRAIGLSLEKLNRYERKYGPDAPQLNIVEVGLNYVAQWVPQFRPTPDGWPSRLEVVTSYVPTYLTSVDRRARAITIAEIGLRSYLWKRGWGGSAGSVLRPGYLSYGLAVAGERDGAFVSPVSGSRRFGAFVGWGQTKIAVIGGDAPRVLFTRQMQIVPLVF
jgi:hypothetical protein